LEWRVNFYGGVRFVGHIRRSSFPFNRSDLYGGAHGSRGNTDERQTKMGVRSIWNGFRCDDGQASRGQNQDEETPADWSWLKGMIAVGIN
jgi:hypothetical protein